MIYVDDMRAPFGRIIMCHMMADSDAELHEMAHRLGIRRNWYQGPPKTSVSHYDIGMGKRRKAIELGAIAVTLRQMARMNIRRRETGKFGPHTDIDEWFKLRGERIRSTMPGAEQWANVTSVSSIT